MSKLIAITALALTLALTPVAATAAPNQQLVASVQHRLNILGFRDVDASTLSNHQIGALHMKLQGPMGFGYRTIRLRQEVKVILGWFDN